MRNRSLLSVLFCSFALCLFAQSPVSTVQKFGTAMSNWCRTDDIMYHEQAKKLASGKMKCIVDDKITQDAVEKDESRLLTNGTQELMSYLNIFQTAILNGQKYEMLNVQDRPDFVEPTAFKNETPPSFVSADLLLNGQLNFNVTDIFYVREGKITKIIDFSSDISLGKALELYSKRKYDEAFKMFRTLAYKDWGNFDAQYYMVVMELNKQGCSFMDKSVRDKEIIWFVYKNLLAGNDDVAKLVMKFPMDTKILDYSRFPRLFQGIIGCKQPMESGLMMFFNKKSGKCGFVNEAGKLVVPHKYLTAYPFHDGRAMVVSKETNKCGFIDEKGNEIIPLIYQNAICDFYKGRTWCIKDGTAYLIDKQGKVLKEVAGYPLLNTLTPTGRYAMLYKSEKQYDVYDYDGNLILEDYETWNVKSGVVTMIKQGAPEGQYKIEW